MVQGNVIISNVTKNENSLAVSVQRCYFSLIALKVRGMMFDFWLKLLEDDALKVQIIVSKTVFLSSFALWPVSENLSLSGACHILICSV